MILWCAMEQIGEGFFHGGEAELETVGKESGGDDVAAFDHQLAFGAKKEGAAFEHAARGGQADGHVALAAEAAHHFFVGERMRGGEVDDAVETVVVDEPLDGAAEVGCVNPRDHLPAAGHGAAQAEARETSEDGEYAPAAAAENHGGTEGDFARGRNGGRGEFAFPGGGHFN